MQKNKALLVNLNQLLRVKRLNCVQATLQQFVYERRRLITIVHSVTVNCLHIPLYRYLLSRDGALIELLALTKNNERCEIGIVRPTFGLICLCPPIQKGV